MDINEIKFPMNRHLKVSSPTISKYKISSEKISTYNEKTKSLCFETDNGITTSLDSAYKFLTQFTVNPEAFKNSFACFFDGKELKKLESSRTIKHYPATNNWNLIIERIKQFFKVINETQLIFIFDGNNSQTSSFKTLTDKYKTIIQNLENKLIDLKSQHGKEKEKVVKIVSDLEKKLTYKNTKIKELEKKLENKSISERNMSNKKSLFEEPGYNAEIIKMKHEKRELKYKAQILKKNEQIEFLIKTLEASNCYSKSNLHNSNYPSELFINKPNFEVSSRHCNDQIKVHRDKSLNMKNKRPYFTPDNNTNNIDIRNEKLDKGKNVHEFEVSEFFDDSKLINKTKCKENSKSQLYCELDLEASNINECHNTLRENLLKSSIHPHNDVNPTPKFKNLKFNAYNFFSKYSIHDISGKEKNNSLANTLELPINQKQDVNSGVYEMKDKYKQQITNYEVQLAVMYQISKAKAENYDEIIQALVPKYEYYLNSEEAKIIQHFNQYKNKIGVMKSLGNYNKVNERDKNYNRSFNETIKDENLLNSYRRVSMDMNIEKINGKLQEKKQVIKILIDKIIQLEKQKTATDFDEKCRLLSQMYDENTDENKELEMQKLIDICNKLKLELETKNEELRQIRDVNKIPACKFNESNNSHVTLRNKYGSQTIHSTPITVETGNTLQNNANAYYKDLIIDGMSYIIDRPNQEFQNYKFDKQKYIFSFVEDFIGNFLVKIQESNSVANNKNFKECIKKYFSTFIHFLNDMHNYFNRNITEDYKKLSKPELSKFIRDYLQKNNFMDMINLVHDDKYFIEQDSINNQYSYFDIEAKPTINNDKLEHYEITIKNLSEKLLNIDKSYTSALQEIGMKVNHLEASVLYYKSFKDNRSQKLYEMKRKTSSLQANMANLIQIMTKRFGQALANLKDLKVKFYSKTSLLKTGVKNLKKKLLEYHEILSAIGEELGLNFYDIKVPDLINTLSKIKNNAKSYTELRSLYSKYEEHNKVSVLLKPRINFLVKLETEYKAYFSKDLNFRTDNDCLIHSFICGTILNNPVNVLENTKSEKLPPKFSEYEKIRILIKNIEEASGLKIKNFKDEMLNSPINQLWSKESFDGFCTLVKQSDLQNNSGPVNIIDKIDQHYKTKYQKIIDEIKSENNYTLMENNKLITKYVNVQHENLIFKKHNHCTNHADIDIKKYNKLKLHLKNLENKMAFVNKILKCLDLDVNDKNLKGKFLDKISNLMYDSTKINLSVLKEPSRNYKNLGRISEEDSMNNSQHYNISLDKFLNYSVKEPINKNVGEFNYHQTNKLKAYSENNKPQIKGLSLINTFNDVNLISKSTTKSNMDYEAFFENTFKK